MPDSLASFLLVPEAFLYTKPAPPYFHSAVAVLKKPLQCSKGRG